MIFPRFWQGLFALGLVILALPLTAEESVPAFRFADKTFSSAETAKLAALPAASPLPPNATVLQKLEAQRELIGGIALFARDGITLSEEETFFEVGSEMLLLETTERARLKEKLAGQNLTMPEFCRQQAQDIRKQFAVAARKWYQKKFAGDDAISKSQVRDWYFRHQLRFLAEELNPDKCFMLASREVVPTVLAMLAQGSGAGEVRQAVHALPLPADTLHWLNNAPVKRETPAPGYTLVTGNDRILLLADGARRKHYRKLDAELYHAIEQALYDALARARLAAALEEELQNAKIEILD